MSVGPSCGRNSALSLHAPCWDGAGGEAKQGMAVPLGRDGSGQILTRALAHRKDGKRGVSSVPEKTAAAPSVPVREGQ